jgi:transcription-repair coupling factor (superfamily II helicase)
MGVKIASQRARVSRVDAGTNAVTITFAEDARIAPDKVMTLVKRSKGRIKLIPEYTLQITLPDTTLRTASDAVKKCLQDLG